MHVQHVGSTTFVFFFVVCRNLVAIWIEASYRQYKMSLQLTIDYCRTYPNLAAAVREQVALNGDLSRLTTYDMDWTHRARYPYFLHLPEWAYQAKYEQEIVQSAGDELHHNLLAPLCCSCQRT